MNGSWDTYLASPADLARVDDIITDLAIEKRAWDQDHRTYSLIFDYYLKIGRQCSAEQNNLKLS